MPEEDQKKLVTDKGFGFIEGDRGDMFFHHSTVEGVTFEDLREGQTVEYEVGKGARGPTLEHVRRSTSARKLDRKHANRRETSRLGLLFSCGFVVAGRLACNSRSRK